MARILVVGVGVIGSYLAWELDQAGHEVVLLARGMRKESLERNGLCIKHWLQHRSTCSCLAVIDSCAGQGTFDTVFFAMQRTGIEAAVSQVCGNCSCSLLVLVGNNPNARQMMERLRSCIPKGASLLCAFQGTGGRRDGDLVVSLHTRHPSFTIGSMDADAIHTAVVDRLFTGTSFLVVHSPDIDAWMKCHVAGILPLAYAVYACGRNLRPIAWDRTLLDTIAGAVAEGYQVLKACGFRIEPVGSDQWMHDHAGKYRQFLRLLALTPIGKLAVSDHAMAAKDEMIALDTDFQHLVNRADIETPCLDRMRFLAGLAGQS